MKINPVRLVLLLTISLSGLTLQQCKKNDISKSAKAEVANSLSAKSFDETSISAPYVIRTLAHFNNVDINFSRVCTGPAGYVYASAYSPKTSGVIYKISSKGVVSKFAKLGTGQFFTGVKAMDNGDIYYTSSEYEGLKVFKLTQLGVKSEIRYTLPYLISDLAVAPDGTVYISSAAYHCIMKITPDGVSSVLAGQPNQEGFVNGSGQNARFAFPSTIKYASEGYLVVEDGPYNRLRKISLNGQVSTIYTLSGPYRDYHIDDFSIVKRKSDLTVSPFENLILSTSLSKFIKPSQYNINEISHLSYDGKLTTILKDSTKAVQYGMTLTSGKGIIYYYEYYNNRFRTISRQ
ncbi:hypothetical protein GS399_09140 [Pedobacter sp. HMF7647]|uniref:Uncharacterized protein n=1 Tax=Hufsiella arboris TaxID=2695275 RepID=A0A7K1Y964_9SPHI|nr:hypothetical protein [Hufsiella arboris]MXV51132.1 hypothetical protein [Hufsiella arboris]